MSVFIKFAVIGAGGVGGTVVDELLKKYSSVAILTRAFKARGATLYQVSYDDEATVTKALCGSDVVVNTVAAYFIKEQRVIISAVKVAGIQLFVPSEYGVRVTKGPNVIKRQVQDLLTQHQIPFIIFYTGIFAELLSTFLDYHYDEGYMNVMGKGETAFSITARTDVGRFVAHVLATAPRNKLEGAKIPFEAERLSALQIRDLAEKKLDKMIEVCLIDYEENKKKFDTGYPAFLTTLFEDGRGAVGTEQEVQQSVAEFFPDWKPVKYESFI
ncbi:hypothetical protein PHMEG_00014158 [Phytophthora megakarya]|uniref:NmrA-like domain-containing protein n=1 Tax=Phytophthora megakarya TaxID=4795 RepID=A0A225W516_9STRA|nr:hypothetical protein PHMEG_00014158 [Phytophthora megakarya]